MRETKVASISLYYNDTLLKTSTVDDGKVELFQDGQINRLVYTLEYTPPVQICAGDRWQVIVGHRQVLVSLAVFDEKGVCAHGDLTDDSVKFTTDASVWMQRAEVCFSPVRVERGDLFQVTPDGLRAVDDSRMTITRPEKRV